MKRLYLLRHAKSSWDDPARSDFERPLSKRGRRAAPAIGRYIQKEDLQPHLVLCSTARRARETLELVAADWTPKPEIRFEDALYLAEPETILRFLAALPDSESSAMAIGHNPGLQRLASELGATDSSAAMARLRTKFPTGSLAAFDIDIDHWHDIEGGRAKLTKFIAPRDID